MTATTDVADRRREPRTACTRRLAVMGLAQAGGEWTYRDVEMIDCSTRGLGFTDTQSMTVGDEFFAKLIVGADLRLILYTVRRCEPIPDHRYRIGAEFTGYIGASDQPADERLLHALLTAPQPTA